MSTAGTSAVHVAVRPGAGVVARTGAAVMVALPGGSDQLQGELLEAFTAACEGQEAPGRMLARKLVGLLSQANPDDVPSFGACAPNERGWAVILHQGVALHVEHASGTTSLSGYEASTWVDRIVEDGFASLTMLAADADAGPVDTRFRFDGGVIPGAGATILPGDAVRATAVPAPGAPTAAPQPDPAGAAPMAADAAPVAAADAGAIDRSPLTAEGAMPAGAMVAPAGPAPLPERPMPPTAQPVAPPPTDPVGSSPPTPTPDPVQQSAPEATPVAPPPGPPPAAHPADGGLLAKTAAPDPVGMPDEDEPPTLIQSPSRDAEPVAADAQPVAEDLPGEDVPFESVPLLDIGTEARRDPLPVLTADTPKDEIEDTGSPLVYGVLSPTGYFNHPDALFCAVTGVSMLHRTHVLVQRPRPPLGVVVADDGSTFTLNSNYIVGREPERDPQVEADDARPLKLQDAERSLSRVHAEIRLVDWDVAIVDRGSANGTYVLPRGGQQWKRLVADTPEKIVPGTRVAFGKRVMTYESHHQINQAVAS